VIRLRELQDKDWPLVWEFVQPVIKAGETYPYALDMTASQAHHLWLNVTEAAYVAEDESGEILGSYYLKANQPTLGAHVANCGYIVSAQARGRGIATQMCEHSQDQARKRGFRAMQFNLVVETNEASVHLWEKLGFDIVGTLPGAFKHAKLGFVDAFVMYKVLADNT